MRACARPIRTEPLLLADRHGIQTLPLGVVEDVADVTQKIRTEEQTILFLFRSKDFTLEALR
jgi:hypothetical protein